MSNIIYILIIIIVIAIIIVWYISSNIKEKSNNTELVLNTDDDKILSQWLQENKKQTFNYSLSNEEIVSKLIKKIYNFDVDHKNIIIGHNLKQKYYNLTRNEIQTKFSEEQDCILYLRSIIGINYEICIINSSTNIFDKLQNLQNDIITEDSIDSLENNINIYFLNDIIESNLEKTAYDHIRKVLNIRWSKILETKNNYILERNSDDSFLYLKSNHTIPNLISYNNELKEDRINLLCNNVEFEALIHRLNSKEKLEREP